MQKSTLFTIAASFLFLVFCFSATAQTNVSGGIYTNTTWTLANSPYIVVDTVVVFPGDTLTIEPGVTVKFKNNKLIEIRGYLIASGTAVDSINFTSDSLVPYAGIWKGIFFNNLNSQKVMIDYCIFKYAGGALWGTYDSLVVAHSSFYFNNASIGFAKIIKQCFFYDNFDCCVSGGNIDSCTFTNNSYAVGDAANVSNSTFIGDSLGIYDGWNISNCIFLNNQYAVYIEGSFNNANLFQNSIFCNNVYGVFGAVNDIINCNFSQNQLACDCGVGKFVGNIFTDNDIAIDGWADTLINNYIYHNDTALGSAISAGDLIFNI